MHASKPTGITPLDRVGPRTGTTLMEVLFAIGIVLVGLVGIAALIPLAGRQVVDSKTATLGAAMAQNAYRAIEAANLHVPSTDRPWLIARDDSNHPTGQQFTAYGSFESLIDAEATWVANLAINNGVANTVAIPLARAYASRRGYCIEMPPARRPCHWTRAQRAPIFRIVDRDSPTITNDLIRSMASI
jgi:hypothetical protein